MAALYMFEYLSNCMIFGKKKSDFQKVTESLKTSPWGGSLSKGFIETRPKMSLYLKLF